MWKYEDEHTQERELGGTGCGGVATRQLFHFVPFILMIFYVTLCPVIHTFLVYLWLSDVQMPENIYTNNWGDIK